MREKMLAKFVMLISSVSTYNVNQLPASIINKPGVFQPEMVNLYSNGSSSLISGSIQTSYFGFSLAARDINGETSILIGAPAYKDFGALYKCNEYGQCDDYYPGELIF